MDAPEDDEPLSPDEETALEERRAEHLGGESGPIPALDFKLT
jgi:hypothetical protein